MQGSSREALITSYADVARCLDLQADDGQEHVAVGRWISQHRPCLVVVDNVDHVIESVEDILPSTGHLLMTSRDKKWKRRVYHVVRIPVFEKAEALELLREESDAAEELAKRLDYLPVGLSVARDYIEAEQDDGQDFTAAE